MLLETKFSTIVLSWVFMDVEMQFALFDLVAHPVFVLASDREANWRCLKLNSTAAKALNLADQGEKELAECFPNQLANTIGGLAETAKRTERPYITEQKMQLGDNMRLVRLQLHPLTSATNGTQFVIGSWDDITEKCYQKPNSFDTAEETQDFICVAAHDLRAPMQRVSAAADMLRDGFQDLGDGKLELINMLERVSTNAIEMISDVLSYAEAQTVGGPRMEFDAGKLIDSLMLMLDPDQCVEYNFTDCLLTCDRTVLQCVLRNLLDNSMRHASLEDDSLKVSITFRPTGDYIRLIYEDNGTGFEPDLLFQPARNFIRNAGFGMLAMRRIVHAQGGSIVAGHSESGRGAKIMIGLPGRFATKQGKDDLRSAS